MSSAIFLSIVAFIRADSHYRGGVIEITTGYARARRGNKRFACWTARDVLSPRVFLGNDHVKWMLRNWCRTSETKRKSMRTGVALRRIALHQVFRVWCIPLLEYRGKYHRVDRSSTYRCKHAWYRAIARVFPPISRALSHLSVQRRIIVAISPYRTATCA